MSIQRTYKSGQERFPKFCDQSNSTPLPVSQCLLCSYVAYLAYQGLKHGTIKVYLSAVRNIQISYGFDDPSGEVPFPQLDLVMRDIKRAEAEKGVSKRELLPISPLILSWLNEVWSLSGHTHDTKMVWAA